MKAVLEKRCAWVSVVLGGLVLLVGCSGGGRARLEPRGVPAQGLQAQALRAEQLPDRIRVLVDGALFTEYKYADDQKYPYFYPVRGPRSGESVTTESSEPYPHHHSLFFSCDKVNGGNYWQEGLERGRIVARETRLEQAAGEAVVFTQTSLWERPDAPAPFRDHRRVRISAPSPELRLIDFEISLVPLVDVRIENTNHALFSARMTPELSVTSGGTLVNAQGDRSEDGTWGERAPWADYWGDRGAGAEGLAILTHPDNRWYPAPWFTRNYGFFSPTPMNWLEGGHLDLPRGEPLRLRYRVVVHAGSTQEAGIEQLFKDYVALKF